MGVEGGGEESLCPQFEILGGGGGSGRGLWYGRVAPPPDLLLCLRLRPNSPFESQGKDSEERSPQKGRSFRPEFLRVVNTGLILPFR